MAKKSFKETVQEELFKISEFDLADAIDQLESDKDVREYIWANRAYFDKTIPADAMKDAPAFRDIVYGEAPNAPLDLDKTFGKDWDKDFANIPYNKIEYVAEQKGLNPKELNKQMADIATQRQRYRIAHGEDEGGWFDSPKAFAHNLGGATMTLFGRRQQEAIARGEEPMAKDYIGDIGESALYAVPYGRGLQAVGAIGKGGRVARILSSPGAQYVAGSTVAPVASEAYDAAVYDDENPRGHFSGADVGGGILTNVAAPVVLRGLASRAGRFLPAAKNFTTYADETIVPREDLLKDLNRSWTEQSRKQMLNTKLNTGKKLTPSQQVEAAQFNKDYKTEFDKVLKKLRKGEALTKEEILFANSDPSLTKYFHAPEAPTRGELATQEGVKNWVTNQFGSLHPQETPIYARIPYAGPALQQYFKEQDEEEEQRQKERELEKKWDIRFGVK